MKKVQLVKGIPRWRRHDFSIARGEIKDCPDEIFDTSNGRLEIVKEKPKIQKKKKEKPPKTLEELKDE